MNATSLIRWSTVAAVAGIAGVAGWVSYEHALAVVRAHGESGAVAAAYPVTIDGLIYSASMVLLDTARRDVRAPALARWVLAVGIGATLVANVAAGIRFGVMGAVVAAWPALALVGSYELLMTIIRREAVPARDVTTETVAADVTGVPGPAAGSVNGHVPVVDVPTAPARRAQTVAPTRAPQRTSGAQRTSTREGVRR